MPTQPTPAFFVPGAPAADQEAAYAELARIADRTAPPAGERIFAMTFGHDGEVWTATVGERLVGERWRKVGRPRVERMQHLSDPARVLAIFAGHPFTVVLDGTRSAWSNPFCAGDLRSIVRFALDDA